MPSTTSTKVVFNQERALEADRGGVGITSSGVYYGTLTKADCGVTPAGAQYTEFGFKEESSGLKTDYLRLYLTTREGEHSFGSNIFHSLLGLLGLSEVSIVSTDEKSGRMPALLSRPIGVVLQKESYYNANGEEKYKFNILHFIDHKTHQTYSERQNNLPPETYLRPIADKPADVSANSAVTPDWEDSKVEPGADVGDGLPF